MNRRVALFATLGSGADVLARQGIQFAFLLVLAHLATPEDFGTIALLGVIVGVANVAKRIPRSGSKRSIACMRPIVPTPIRSSSGSPRLANFFAKKRTRFI